MTSARQGRIPITLKGEIDALLASGKVGSHALILDDKDVILLLKAAVEKEGSVSAFAKRHGLERTNQHFEWKTACEQFPGESFGAAQRVYT